MRVSFALSRRDADLGLLANLTVARGNIAVADHGVTVGEEVTRPAAPVDARFRLRLARGPLTMTDEPAGSAPAVALRVAEEGGELESWRAVPDLLDSPPAERHFVAELDDEGRAAGGGFDRHAVALESHLAALDRRIGQGPLPGLSAAMRWLLDRRPLDGARVICHGDFHPQNLLAADGRVSAVLDWPNALVADAECDVAATLVILRLTPIELFPVPATLRPLLAGLRSVMTARYLARYVGRASHAGGAPHLGVNALYAAQIGLMAINALRETFRDEDSIRVHPILTHGGSQVNVIPGEARLEMYVRGKTVEGVADASRRVDRALRAGALAMGARVEIDTLPGPMPLYCDRAMGRFFEATARGLVESVVRELGVRFVQDAGRSRR